MGHFNWFGRGLPLQLAIMAVCQMAFILFGVDQGIFSGIIGNEDFLEVVDHPNPTLLGIIVSSYDLGCWVGCILTFLVGDYLGRRKSMWLAMAWIIIGAILQTSAMSTGHLIAGRVITGVGTGIETSTVPMYQSELVEAHKRGRIVCWEPLFVGVGIVIAYFLDYGMSVSAVGTQPIAWRLPIASQMVFAFVVIVLVFGLPESPRWCYRNGRNEEALQALCDVYDCQPDDQKVLTEQKEILQAIELETQHGEYKWSQILRKDDVGTNIRVLLAYGMQFMNQMGGINLVVYYITTVLQENVGLTRNLSLILGGCIQTMFVIGSFYPALYCDRSGRRGPMIWGSLGLGICMMLIAILLSFKGTAIEHSASAAAVAFFFLYQLIFGGTANSIPWAYVPEILPLHVRAKGTAIGISANWLWNFLVVMITPVAITNLQWKAYLIFMCTNFAFVPLVYFYYPETAGLTLEEVDFLFSNPEKGAVKTSLELWKDRKSGRKRAALGMQQTNGDLESESPAEKSEVDAEHKEHKY